MMLWDSRKNEVIKTNDFDTSLAVLNPYFDS